LEVEREKVKELTSTLRVLHPAGAGPVLPIVELVAVPEQYVGKNVVVEGNLIDPAQLRDPISHFWVSSSDGAPVALNWFFITQDLDPNSRRLLVATKRGDLLHVSGLLIKSGPEGLAWKLGLPTGSGL